MRGELTASSPFDPPRLRRSWVVVERDCSCHQDGRPGWAPAIHPDDPSLECWVKCERCDGTGTLTREERGDD